MEAQEFFEELGVHIRELRRAFAGRGISQSELARRLGVTANTVSRWESGIYRPSGMDIVNLAIFFGIPPSQLLPEPSITPVEKKLAYATEGLNSKDLEDIIAFARFRRAVSLNEGDTAQP